MPKTPSLTGNEIIRILQRAGFIVKRQRGSHVLLTNEDTRRATVVPVHGNRPVPIGTFYSILQQAGLTVTDFVELMNK